MAIDIHSKRIQFLFWVGALLVVMGYGFLQGHTPTKAVLQSDTIISIDRSEPFFNPVNFIGNDWVIEEQDDCSLALTDLDIKKIYLKNMLKEGEASVKGTENLRRLKESEYVRLDAAVLKLLWENQYLIPDSWKGENDSKVYICFNGTILRNPTYSCHFVLCLYWSGEEWRWYTRRTNDDWRANHYLAVY